MDHFPISFFNIFSPAIFLLTTVTITVLLVLLTLFFIVSFLISGSEVAFFSLSSKEVNLLKTRDRPGFRRIVMLLNKPKSLLASMLIANNFANIAIILIANILLNQWLPLEGMAGFFARFMIILLVVVLFAEMLPKVWATHHKVFFASSASLIVEIFHSIFYGFSNKLVNVSDRIEGSFRKSAYGTYSEESIDDVIDLLPADEASEEEKEMLKGIRKFSDTEVKQIMRTRMDVSGIPYDIALPELLQRLEELNYSRLPVYRSSLDEIEGILHTKDLLAHLNGDAGFDWHTLIRPAFFVHEKKFIKDLLQEFRTRRIHIAVVVDEFGGTSGIVTLEDIIEEVIGDINDEFDHVDSVNVKVDDFNYIFEGKFMINDMSKVIGAPVEAFDKYRGDADSVAGLVLELAGAFPEINEQFVIGKYVFTPLEITKNRIEKVRVTIQQ